tara:strand:+ start:102492 stop:102614 length:123 start_codon:yes stop_codon:yes gene_type:complete
MCKFVSQVLYVTYLPKEVIEEFVCFFWHAFRFCEAAHCVS